MNDDLLDIAFGSRPGATPLAVTSTTTVDPLDSWLRAVALGGRGFYAGAATELDRLRRATDDLALLSLVSSTRASHIRQGGGHAAAYRHDGEALRLVAAERPDPVTVAAGLDALIGLAADSLGSGHLDRADRLLNRAGAHLDVLDDDGPWLWTGRIRLRHAWVRTESALYRGDVSGARSGAAVSARVVVDCPSVRHRLKTELIAAAVAASTGEHAEAIRIASECVTTAHDRGQLPLEWAAVSLMVGMGADTGVGGRSIGVADESRLRGELTARGGAFAGR